ncbi:hypothetical protein [Streptosporangium sp. NPDC003464]
MTPAPCSPCFRNDAIPEADSGKTKYHSRLRGYLAWLSDQADAGALDGVAATGAELQGGGGALTGMGR